jgi:hypothetical protein
MVITITMLQLIDAINHTLKKERSVKIRSPTDVHRDVIQIVISATLVNHHLRICFKVSYLFIYSFFFHKIVANFYSMC